MWTTETVYRWTCDLCGCDLIAGDDLQPAGWTHDQHGHDRCPDCVGKPCGCEPS